MNKFRWTVCITGLLLATLATWQIRAVEAGLRVTAYPGASPPLTLLQPAAAGDSPRPLILVGHGFSGSAVLMRGFGLSLAHAGYRVALWDFAGHGANSQRLPGDLRSEALLQDAQNALQQVEALGLAQRGQVAILGHSMGSGVALRFGLQRPATAAVIAVSPVLIPVTPNLPRNLLLMAGALEAPFVSNAEQILASAGGENGDLPNGRARWLEIIPAVEHVSILFSPAAQQAAVSWLDAVFGVQPGAAGYTDLRIAWYGLGVLGALLLAWAIAGLWPAPVPAASSPPRPLWRQALALLFGATAATLLMQALDSAGLPTARLFGVLIGGYLLPWFGLAGSLAWLGLWQRPPAPSVAAWLGGGAAFALLWLGVGALGQMTWLHWLLIPARLLLWPLGTLLALPWFLAVGQAFARSRWLGLLGWQLVQSLFLLGGLALALRLNPALGFLILILPLLPLVLALHALASAPYRSAWAFALSGSAFLSWLLLAVFPLQ
jgi:pimeloyl-ACP methyl ester carboxylesterase